MIIDLLELVLQPHTPILLDPGRCRHLRVRLLHADLNRLIKVCLELILANRVGQDDLVELLLLSHHRTLLLGWCLRMVMMWH